MCIIAIKQAGIPLPDMNTIEEMWYNNPDGAGIMYPQDGKVRIVKGMMHLKDVKREIEMLGKRIDVLETPVIMHFRIGTHGGKTPQNTHPFPVSSSIPLLQKTIMSTNVAVAHNGIISKMYPRAGISDTMEYIASQMSLIKKIRPDFYKNDNCMKLIENAIDSKMAFLDNYGFISTIGQFEKADDGLIYSNGTYKQTRMSEYARYDEEYGSDYVQPIYGMVLEEEDGYIRFLRSNHTADSYGYVIGTDDRVYFESSYQNVVAVNAEVLTHSGLPYHFRYRLKDRTYGFFYPISVPSIKSLKELAERIE